VVGTDAGVADAGTATDAATETDAATATATDAATATETDAATATETDAATATATATETDAATATDTDAGPATATGGGDGLGDCTGTTAECEAARVVNEYRASHVHAGECNHPLRWDANLGRLAHEHQRGPSIGHSSHGYVEVVGQAYGVRDTAEYIMQWEAGIEEHCGPDGSYTVSHHCASLYCPSETIGIGVYEGGGGGATYMTIMFGGERGEPAW